MRKHRVITGLAVAVIGVGAWIALESNHPTATGHHRSPPGANDGTGITWHRRAHAPVAAWSADEAMRASVPTPWTRPPAALTAARSEQTGLAWIMRQLGASDRLIGELAGGDIAGAVQRLKRRAIMGDATAVNVLGEFAYQQCSLGRPPATLDRFASAERTEARRLPPLDAAWFDAAVNADVAYDQRVDAVCAQSIDLDEIMAMVGAKANAGNGGSAWLMSRNAGTLIGMQRWLRNAAIEGFPQAQYELAIAIIAGQQGAAGAGPNAVTAGAMLRESAAALPDAQGQLGICEFQGCPGIAANPARAIRDARQAAERGSMDAILDIGPKVQQSLIDPDEVSAWRLVHASLEQQGCISPGINLLWMGDIESTLRTADATPHARRLARKVWREYGGRIIANLDCHGRAN